MESKFAIAVVPLLWVNDIEVSIEFFGRLGFGVSETWEPEGKVEWCSMKFENAELMLQQSDKTSSTKSHPLAAQEIELYFVCNDVDSLYRHYKHVGLAVSKPKVAFYPMKQMFIRDPDGRSICFETPVGS